MKNTIKILLIAVSAVLMSCGNNDTKKASKDDTVIIKFAYDNQPGEGQDLAARKWKELAEKYSDNRISVELYPSGQLGNKNDLTEQIVLGANIITASEAPFLMDFSKEFGILAAPYFSDSYDEYFKVFDTEWYANQITNLNKKGVDVVANNWIYGDRHIMTHKPIRHPNDTKGIKVRVPNAQLYVASWQAFGATPTPMGFTEIYTAVAQKVIDGAENPIGVLYNLKLQEHSKYLSLTAHMNHISYWIGSVEFFNSIDPELKEIFVRAGKEAGEYKNELLAKEEEATLKLFEEAGVTIITDIDRDAFRKASESVYAKFWSLELYESLRKEMKK